MPPPTSRSPKKATRSRKHTPGQGGDGSGARAVEPDAEFRRLVRLDGLAVRRRRHDRGWSPRALVGAIEEASFNASGLRRTLTPNQIEAIEERAERISYEELLLLADGLDCDPSDLIAEGEMSSQRPGRRLH